MLTSPLIVAILSGRLAATPTQPKPDAPPVVAVHRFWDPLNISLIAIESGALLADGITTQRALARCPNGREADPIARPFVNAGWPGQILGGTLFVAAEVGLRYLVHQHGHHTLERWLPMVLTTYGTVGAIHNGYELHKLDEDPAAQFFCLAR